MRYAALFALLLVLGCAHDRYIIYAHGKAVEDGGRRPDTRFGVYEYDRILDAFRHAGFHVISDQREKDADPSTAADRIVEQTRDLIRRGVPPSRITIIGASKGAVITMLASTRLQEPNVRYVLLGNCNDGILRGRQPKLSGRVLSVFERSDEYGGTCDAFFKNAGDLREHDEVALDLGIGHAFLYTPRAEWLEPAIEWARH